MLDLGRLTTFATVVEVGSFSAAAHALHLTQPAVSRQVALLERQLRTSLLIRARSGVRLTAAGQLLLDHATAAMDRLTLAEAQLAALADARTGSTRLGSFFSALVHLSAEVAADVGDHHPYLRIIDDLVDRSGAIAKLIRGELDLAIVFDHDFAPTTAAPEGIRIQRLFDDPIRVLLPTTHPLARGPVIDVASLATDTWIRAIDGGAADLTEHVLSRHRLNPPILLAGHGDEPVEIQALVAAGRGVTLTHDLTVIVNRHDLAVLPIAEDAGVRHIDVAHADGPQTAATETVLKALRKIGARHQQRLHGRD